MEGVDIAYYENLALKKSDDYDIIISALELVKKFILHKQRILVGGVSIDFALKNKNHPGIYSESALLDYDIISDTYWQDAYEIAVRLKKAGFEDISVINAMHPTTMKVRINFKEVIDITYIPKKILDSIPVIYHRGYRIVHPHYQFIDQHRALSYPYENPPYETILFRAKKDMLRYDMLYYYFPLRMLNIHTKNIQFKDIKLPLKIFTNQCLSGFVALNYWIAEAKKLGFKTDINVGSFYINLNDKSNPILELKIPKSTNIDIISNDVEKLTSLLFTMSGIKYNDNSNDKPNDKTNTGSKYITCYKSFLDKISKKCKIET